MEGGFEIGNVVTLKSGGQKMTVVALFTEDEIDFANVVWCLGGSAKHGRGTFPTAALETFEENS